MKPALVYFNILLKKFLFFFFFLLSISNAQTEDSLQYYPMAVGNYWYYSQQMGNGYWLKVTSDSIDDKGNKYFFLKGSRYHRFCLDKEGYLYEDNYRLYKLNAKLGERWWAIGDGIDTTWGMWGVVNQISDVILFNKITRIKSYSFYGRHMEKDRVYDYYRLGYTLAYGIGMIYQDNDANPPYVLGGAIINGVRIGNPVGIKELIKTLPSSFELLQNYPNPFNPETTIQYTIPASLNPSKGGTFVSLKVFDLLGREVVTLVDEYKQPGNYKAIFNVKTLRATSLPSGVFFYTLTSNGSTQTKKMLVIK